MSEGSGLFPPGFCLDQNGQIYWPLGIEPYLRKDGELTSLVVWESECWECGAVFTTKSPLRVNVYLSRRCEGCKAPGKPRQLEKAR